MSKNRFTLDDLKKMGLEEVKPGQYQSVNKGIKPDFTKKGVGQKPYKFPLTKHVVPKEFKQQIDELTHIGVSSAPLIVFNINPIGAPRMTRSDRWKLDPNHKDPRKRQRKPVTQYFKFRKDIMAQALKYGFKMPESDFHVVFIIPMSPSWPTKKQNQMNNSPHQLRPDVDNLIKAVKDSLCSEDSHIWDYRITKYWGRTGRIIIYPINKI